MSLKQYTCKNSLTVSLSIAVTVVKTDWRGWYSEILAEYALSLKTGEWSLISKIVICTLVMSVFVRSFTSEAYAFKFWLRLIILNNILVQYHDSKCVLLIGFTVQTFGVDINDTSIIVNSKALYTINVKVSRSYFINHIIVNSKVLINCYYLCHRGILKEVVCSLIMILSQSLFFKGRVNVAIGTNND